MDIGSVVRLTHIRSVGVDGKSWFEFKPQFEGEDEKEAKGRVFVVILLGTEPKVITKKEDRLNPIKRLNELGWQQVSEPDKKKANGV